MEKVIEEIREEHEELRGLLFELEDCMENDVLRVIEKDLFSKLGEIWGVHEEKEEKLFEDSGMEFPMRKMFVKQHRELKGYWKILSGLCVPGNERKLAVALDTDGRMMINKFRKHMYAEEKYFDILIDKLKEV